MHVVKSSVELLLDYVMNTPEDGLTSASCVQQRNSLIEKNIKLFNENKIDKLI